MSGTTGAAIPPAVLPILSCIQRFLNQNFEEKNKNMLYNFAEFIFIKWYSLYIDGQSHR